MNHHPFQYLHNPEAMISSRQYLGKKKKSWILLFVKKRKNKKVFFFFYYWFKFFFFFPFRNTRYLLPGRKLWHWRRLLRVPWTARRPNQSTPKAISPGCSLEGLMIKLKLQYFGYLMQRVDSLEKTLMLGGIGGRRRREWQKMRCEMAGWHHRLDGHKFE